MFNGINHITISVNNINVSFDFYMNILKLKPIMKSEYSAYFLCGNIWIALVEESSKEQFISLYSHIALNTSKSKYKRIIDNLKKSNIKEWQDNKTEGESFYFLDPSGNKLEIHYSSLYKRIKSLKKQLNITIY